MNFPFAFNAFEVVLWTSFSLMLFSGRIRTGHRRREIAAAVTFLAFALSDAVEMSTGAWWRPWWLFVWKLGCAISLLGIAVAHFSDVQNTGRTN